MIIIISWFISDAGCCWLPMMMMMMLNWSWSSIHPSIYPTIYLSMYPTIHPSNHPSIHSFVSLFAFFYFESVSLTLLLVWRARHFVFYKCILHTHLHTHSYIYFVSFHCVIPIQFLYDQQRSTVSGKNKILNRIWWCHFFSSTLQGKFLLSHWETRTFTLDRFFVFSITISVWFINPLDLSTHWKKIIHTLANLVSFSSASSSSSTSFLILNSYLIN